jgi:MFS family permease
MPDRPHFRIMDLIVLVAASAVATGGATALQQMPEHDQGKVAFWLVFAGVLLVGYMAARFGRTPEVRLIVVGVAIAFAGAADAMFLDVYSDAPTAAVVACAGLTLASLVLLVGGVVNGLRSRRLPKEPRPDGRPLDAVKSPHPLDRDLIP